MTGRRDDRTLRSGWHDRCLTREDRRCAPDDRRFISVTPKAWATRLVGFSIQRADDLWPLNSGRSAAIPNQKRGHGYQASNETSFLRKMRRVKVVAVMIFLVLGLLGGAKADEENKKTIVSFNRRFEIPGGQVLPAGKYVFKVLDPSANPNVIQIFSEDEKHLYATIMALPKYRLRQTEKTVMTFSARAAGVPEAIRTWFYPGSTRGVEFMYPKMRPRAVDLAKLASKPAPAKPKAVAKKPPKIAARKHKRVKPVPPPEVATKPAPATVAALPGIQPTKEKFGVNVDVLNRVPVEFPEASREPARPQQQVPRKRNVVPDLIVVGLILGALVLLLLSMRRVRGVVTRKSAARARVKKEGRKAA